MPQHFDGIGENAQPLFQGGGRGVRRAGERARRHVVHGIARAVDAHDVEASFMPRKDHLERALDAARDAEGTRHVVGRSAREIAELHVPLADAL